MFVHDSEIEFRFVRLATDLVTAYLSHNPVPPSVLPGLISTTYTALVEAARSAEVEVESVRRPSPAQIRRSIMNDVLISFVDSKPYKTLKRHLKARGLDPMSYRQLYGLPSDYPMVAPSYSAQRSDLAKSIGLGRLSRKTRRR